MSSRPKPARRRRGPYKPTPATAVSDLINIALLTEGQFPVQSDPVQLLAEDTVIRLTHRQCTNTLVFLALSCRAFAARLPADEREAVRVQIESILVDETLTAMELSLLSDGPAS